MTRHISIVFHSGYGHTAKVAQAVARGVEEGGAQMTLHAIDENGNLPESSWDALDKAHAIIMGTPTYMGGPSWQFKKFADMSSRRWMQQSWKNKIAAGFTNSGSLSGDKLATLQQIQILCMQQSMIWVGMDIMVPTMQGTSVPGADHINRIGSYSGLMTQSNNESPEIVPPAGDLETARLFGERVSQITARFQF
jgi:NAD(P)H dehydrogenase (quinone)